MDYSLPGSSIHGIFQAKVLEWGAIAFSARDSILCQTEGNLMLVMPTMKAWLAPGVVGSVVRLRWYLQGPFQHLFSRLMPEILPFTLDQPSERP